MLARADPARVNSVRQGRNTKAERRPDVGEGRKGLVELVLRQQFAAYAYRGMNAG